MESSQSISRTPQEQLKTLHKAVLGLNEATISFKAQKDTLCHSCKTQEYYAVHKRYAHVLYGIADCRRMLGREGLVPAWLGLVDPKELGQLNKIKGIAQACEKIISEIEMELFKGSLEAI